MTLGPYGPRILAGEVRSPGNVSLRTLSVLRVMSRSDAELFREALRYQLSEEIPWYLTFRVAERLTQDDLASRLPDIGLCYSLYSSTALQNRRLYLDADGRVERVNGDHVVVISGKPSTTIDDYMGGVTVLNKPGIELAPFCDAKSNPAFLRLLATRVHKHYSQEFVLEAAPLIEVSSDGPRYDRRKLRRIKPLEDVEV